MTSYTVVTPSSATYTIPESNGGVLTNLGTNAGPFKYFSYIPYSAITWYVGNGVHSSIQIKVKVRDIRAMSD